MWCRFWAPQDNVMEREKRDRVPYTLWARQGFLTLTPGQSVDYEYIAQDLKEYLEDSEVAVLSFDRWRISFLEKEMERLDLVLPLQPFGQGYKDMSPAIDELETELLNGRFRHGGNPILTMCAANAVVRMDEAGNRKLDKSKATGRIDGIVALLMARGGISKEETEEEKKYEMFFV